MIQQFLNRNSASFNQILRTYDWLVVWNLNFMTFHLEPEFYDFPFSWEFHHPNWRTPSFFRGVGIPPTSMLFSIIYGMSSFPLTCSIAMFLFTQRVTLNGGFQVMGVPPNHVMNDHFNIETIWNPCFFFSRGQPTDAQHQSSWFSGSHLHVPAGVREMLVPMWSSEYGSMSENPVEMARWLVPGPAVAVCFFSCFNVDRCPWQMS